MISERTRTEAIELLLAGISVSRTATLLGVSRATVARWRDAEPNYLKRWQAARIERLHKALDQAIADARRDEK